MWCEYIFCFLLAFFVKRVGNNQKKKQISSDLKPNGNESYEKWNTMWKRRAYNTRKKEKCSSTQTKIHIVYPRFPCVLDLAGAVSMYLVCVHVVVGTYVVIYTKLVEKCVLRVFLYHMKKDNTLVGFCRLFIMTRRWKEAFLVLLCIVHV